MNRGEVEFVVCMVLKEIKPHLKESSMRKWTLEDTYGLSVKIWQEMKA